MQHNSKHGPSNKKILQRKGQTVDPSCCWLAGRFDCQLDEMRQHSIDTVAHVGKRKETTVLACLFSFVSSAARSSRSRDIIEEPLPLSLCEGGGNSLSASPSDVV